MAASTDSTRIIIDLESRLRNLEKTMRGLEQIRKKLAAISQVKVGTQSTAATDRATAAAQRLAQQQQRLSTQSQELANRQERARQATERLRLSQQRLTEAQQRSTQASKGLSIQQDRHVQVFRAMQHAAGQFNRTLNSLGNALRSVGQGFASFGATLAISVSAPLAALAVNVVNAAVRMDSLQRGLTTIAGSSQEAALQLERLTQIAKLPGIGFEEAIQGSIALQAVGFSAADAEKALIQFSNAVALTGGGREQLQSITVQLGQMAAQSKVLAADLKPIINAAPAVAVALRSAFGSVRSEEIQELGIQSKDFIDIMIKELGKLPRATAGARNSFDNFRDTVFRASATIGQSLLPALVQLADTLGPVITGLANAFAALPAPIQSTVLVVGALAIALGPFSFIFGQLITGLGRVVVGFAQLNALGLLPTIANFRLLGRVMIGTASLAQGAAVTAAAAAAGWAALAGAVVAAIGIIAAIATLSTRTKEHVETTEEQIRATEASLKTLREQISVLGTVKEETQAVADASKEVKDIYKSLNLESKGRVNVLQRELGLTRALETELRRLFTVRLQERNIQAATTATTATETAQQVAALGRQIDSTINRVERLRQAREQLLRTGRTQVRDPLLSSVSALDVTRQIERIDKALKQLSTETLTDLRKQSDEATEALAKQSNQLQQLEQATGRSTREILEQAKSYGLFKGDIDIAVQGIEAFRKAQISLEAALSGTTEEMIRQRLELRKLSGPADEAQKQRRLLIDAAVDFARESSSSIDEAKKKLDEFAEKFPEVRKAIEDEKRKGPIEEFLREFTGRKKAGREDTGTSLRNARLQLADAIGQIALAQGQKELDIQRDSDEALLQAQEVSQRLRLVSYREFLETRASITSQLLEKEIIQQLEIVKSARLAQQQLAREALRGDVPQTERVRREAQAKHAEEAIIQAEARLKILEQQRERIDSVLQQDLRLAQDEQIKEINQLEIEYAELQGRIEDALKAATVEKFREALEQLGQAQKSLNKQITETEKLRKPERVTELKQARDLNQRQIESIQNQIRQRDALAQLAAAEKLIENARERQQKLEQDLAFEVEFRGLAEEEAIKRRLAGEERFKASLELARDIIGDVRRGLVNLGLTPPPDLQKFIDNIKTIGLGELSLAEQFRLVQKEFNRIDVERLQRIADVERAVNNRNIAEAEGLLLIRRINGEYVGDLERQLALLKEIAARSGDVNLQRQTQSAEETVKDANDQLASFTRQLRSTSIDAFKDSFTDFFVSLRDNTVTAKEKLLNLVDSVVDRINQVIAENLSQKLIESLFGGGKGAGGGIFAAIGRLLGIGGGAGGAAGGAGGAIASAATGGVDAATATAASTALATGATAAATALTTGGAAAATALTSGGVTASTTLVSSIAAAAASFSAAVVAAGAAFAAAVAASSAAQSGAAAARFIGGGATGLFPAVPGGAYRFVEGGYPEAVLTTDPRYAARQVSILRELIARTRGFYGRIQVPDLAIGGIVSRETAEAKLLNSITRASSFTPTLADAEHATVSGGAMTLRQIFVDDQRDISNWYNSAEGDRVQVQWLARNRPMVRKLLGVRD